MLSVFSRFVKEDGYGRFALQFISAVARLGVDVDVYPLQALSMRENRLNLAILPAHELVAGAGRLWVFSMFEASVIPVEFAECINAYCERLLVPCQQNADAFQRGGVTVPIHIIPGGVEFSEFPLLMDVPSARPYTFLCLGDRGERKGMMQVYTAFHRVFSPDDNVQLLIKARPHMMPTMNETHNAQRVRFWVDNVERMATVYEQADCFVFPSYAEGYGMPAREAAAMGLPVIASRHSGLADHLDCWALPLEKFTERPARSLTSLTLPVDSMWWMPDVDEIGAQMRWCFEHRDEARAKGQAAAKWLRENQTWEKSAQAFIDLMGAWA